MGSTCLTQPSLTEEIAIHEIHDFFREKPFLFFGTGLSCALDVRFGMGALHEELLSKMVEDALTEEEIPIWANVVQSLQNGNDLESALDRVSNQGLIKKITHVTGNFISSLDQEFSFRIANKESEWPAIRLVDRLVRTLPEGDPILHVLTPNYDLLFEYACDNAKIPYTSGFFGGVERKMDWQAVDQALRFQERVVQRGRMKLAYKQRKHIRLYKVHGSLNYFFNENVLVENNAWMWNPPEFAQRVIITPGLSKYETLQRYRQELLKSADIAIDKASRFLFIGYGFNDRHLEEYIKRKLVSQKCKGLIVTRDFNPRIESLLEEATNLWIICKSEGSHATNTRIFNKKYPDWLYLPEKKLWDIREFTSEIFGG